MKRVFIAGLATCVLFIGGVDAATLPQVIKASPPDAFLAVGRGLSLHSLQTVYEGVKLSGRVKKQRWQHRGPRYERNITYTERFGAKHVRVPGIGSSYKGVPTNVTLVLHVKEISRPRRVNTFEFGKLEFKLFQQGGRRASNWVAGNLEPVWKDGWLGFRSDLSSLRTGFVRVSGSKPMPIVNSGRTNLRLFGPALRAGLTQAARILKPFMRRAGRL